MVVSMRYRDTKRGKTFSFSIPQDLFQSTADAANKSFGGCHKDVLPLLLHLMAYNFEYILHTLSNLWKITRSMMFKWLFNSWGVEIRIHTNCCFALLIEVFFFSLEWIILCTIFYPIKIKWEVSFGETDVWSKNRKDVFHQQRLPADKPRSSGFTFVILKGKEGFTQTGSVSQKKTRN